MELTRDLVWADDDGDLANNMASLVCREGCRGVGQGELLENVRAELLEGCDGRWVRMEENGGRGERGGRGDGDTCFVSIDAT